MLNQNLEGNYRTAEEYRGGSCRMYRVRIWREHYRTAEEHRGGSCRKIEAKVCIHEGGEKLGYAEEYGGSCIIW